MNGNPIPHRRTSALRPAAAAVLAALLPLLSARAETAPPPAPPAEAVEPGRELQRQVEARLNACLGPDLSWGHYEGQFKGVTALGPAAARVLVRLFTTPPLLYEFAHPFNDVPAEDPATRGRRKLRIQQLAGDALGEMNDRSVVPDLRTFLENLEKANPDLRDTQRDFHETAAVALLKLGEPLHFENLVRSVRESAGASVDASGTLQAPPAPDRTGRFRQMTALSRLAMLHMRDDNVGGAERAYEKVVELASAEIQLFRKGGAAIPDQYRVIILLQSAYYNLACVNAQRVRKVAALSYLKKAVEFGYLDAEWIKRDRDLDLIRDDPAYAEILALIEQRMKQFREQAEQELRKEKEEGK